jgi:hypothetical protein
VKSRTLPSFWDAYVLLPESVKKAARKGQKRGQAVPPFLSPSLKANTMGVEIGFDTYR